MDLEVYKRYYFWILENNTFPFIDIISSIFLFIVCILYLDSTIKYSKWLVIYVFAIFIFEILNNLEAANRINNHDEYLVYYLIESFLLSLYFLNKIQNKNYTWFVIIGITIISLAIFLNLAWKVDLMNDYAISIQSIIFIIFCLINFYSILKKSTIENLFQYPFFLINCGCLIHFSGKFFISLFLSEINGPEGDLWKLWDIVAISTTIFRIFLAIAFIRLGANLKNGFNLNYQQ